MSIVVNFVMTEIRAGEAKETASASTKPRRDQSVDGRGTRGYETHRHKHADEALGRETSRPSRVPIRGRI